MVKKYSVNEAVWIAAALMSLEVYLKNPNATKSDMYFKQIDIIKRAQTFTENTVHSPRVSSRLNADNKNAIHNYLRASFDDKTRRLAMIDELPSKTYPEKLNLEDKFMMGNGEISMREL